VRIEDFDYTLPEQLIAQRPLETRDASRLMHIDRLCGERWHRQFSQLDEILKPGDLLVVNDTRVIRARLLGKKTGTGGKAELLLIRPEGNAWICIGQSSKGLKEGAHLDFEDGLQAEVLEERGGGEYRVVFSGDPRKTGQVPLPPYITRTPDAADDERYQTIFAQVEGSVAAPTAGLHFTPELLARLDKRGVKRATVTLDVGPGTFLPVRDGEIGAHRMHSERCVIPMETALAMEHAHRIVAVGTTVVRTLETFAAAGVRTGELDTRLFIKPGFEFRRVQAMITNFHLPKSTLLMLVCAFLGTKKTLDAYADAVAKQYRFFSYGDAMFIG
jgi:S-adenosylmethionine:tRNA ribosyltransferase-isomerase